LANIKKTKVKKIILLSLLILISCSKADEDNEVLNDNPSLILEQTNSNSYSATFSLSFSNVENLKLIWNDTKEISMANKIEEKVIDISNNTIVINNLESNKEYYFRLYSQKNNKDYYSDIISISTKKVNITFDNALVSNKLGYLYVSKIKQISDGFIVGANLLIPYGDDSSIEIIKLDNNLNLVWQFNINQSPDSDELGEIHDLQNGDFILTAKKFNYTNVGTYNHQLYGLKFSSTGSIKWIKFYNYQNIQDIDHWYNSPFNYQAKSGQLKILASVDTTYYKGGDGFNREFEIDPEGNIIADKTFGSAYDPPFMNISYDNFGNKFNYGGMDMYPNDALSSYDGLLQKYDKNNNLIWSKSYGKYGADDYFDRIVLNENNIACIGKNGHENGFDGESKWVIQNDSEGNIVWDYMSTRKNFIYQGKDVVYDNQNNLIAMFLDIYYTDHHVYDYASVIKFDNKGNVIWEFRDGEDYNKDNFIPSNIYKINDEYVIIGEKDGSIWGKKFRM
jgi:hypothetical protein